MYVTVFFSRGINDSGKTPRAAEKEHCMMILTELLIEYLYISTYLYVSTIKLF